jgi:hypothetical protein
MRPTTCCVCCRLQRRLTLRYARSIYLLVVVISWMWCFSNGWNPKVQHLVLWVEYMTPLCDLSNHGVQPWLNGIVITIKDCTCHLQCLHYATCIRQWNLAVASVILPGDHASIMRCALRLAPPPRSVWLIDNNLYRIFPQPLCIARVLLNLPFCFRIRALLDRAPGWFWLLNPASNACDVEFIRPLRHAFTYKLMYLSLLQFLAPRRRVHACEISL